MQKKHPYLLAVIIISIVVLGGFIAGYRLQPNFRIAKNGFIHATLPFASTTVFVDDEKIITTTKENQTIHIPLSVDVHDVIVGREGYFPWMSQVTIKSNTESTLKPIFVTQNTTGQIITQKDKEYWTIRNQVNSTLLPSEQNPRQKDGVSIWVDKNTIYLKDEAGTKKILTPKDAVRSLDFYKDRTDVIVFASDVGVYAIDAVENATERVVNFYPIYKGTKPLFEKTADSFLYVLDGENLMMVVL